MPSPSTIFVIAIIVLVCVGTLGMVLLKTAEWLAFRRAGVSPFEGDEGDADENIMSEYANRAPNPRLRAGFEEPVLPHSFQAKPEPVRTIEECLAFLDEHKLSDDEFIDMLATLQRHDDYRISANKIRDIAGGADAVVKARVAARRPKPAPTKPAPRLERPVNGWGKAS